MYYVVLIFYTLTFLRPFLQLHNAETKKFTKHLGQNKS